MEVIGIITLGSVAVAAVGATLLAVKSLPDIRHYRRIRNM